MTYAKIRKAIAEENTKLKKQSEKYIKDVNFSNFDRYLTPAKLRDYKAGKMGTETAKHFAIERRAKEIDKYTDKKLRHLDIIEGNRTPEKIDISVEWKASRTWGKNPTATTTTVTGCTHTIMVGHASGCGYDKESAAVAEALNADNSVRKLLADYRESKEDGKEPRNFTGIIGTIPAIDGGIGMNAVQSILEDCGMKLDYQRHGTNYDFYSFSRKANA